MRADVDLYLTVARRLLGDTAAAPVAGASAAEITMLVNLAMQAGGLQTVGLFGGSRDVDFSQFKPRGHYAGDSRLEPYFRAMIWLGRTDLRFLQYDTFAAPGTPPRFFRRQFLAGLLLAQLTDASAGLASWQQMDDILRAFVGESDNMTVADFPKLRTVAGAATPAALAALPDGAIAQALLDGGFGIQRIASQILYVPPGGAGAPLDRVFLFFGQRFIIDSQVFSDVVFDRVRGEPKRMMPDPLDAAFAALGNNAAAPLLASELGRFPNYPGALHDVRRLVDLHGDDFWGGNLYSAWLGALRGLSVPGGDPTSVAGLPAVMKTEPWARRVLNTQLASWAELRHDTLLYAKQSYTAIPVCDFPDAYVDPYPEAWAGIVRLARIGKTVAAALPASAGTGTRPRIGRRWRPSRRRCGGMAEAERAGQPLTAAQLAFINEAVAEVPMSAGCTQINVPTGWYPRLFLTRSDAQKTDPTIADVHTDPADTAVLHVATGLPRLMIVTADGCNGPRAYAGVVSSYFEKTTSNFQRLTDMEWSTEVMQSPPRRCQLDVGPGRALSTRLGDDAAPIRVARRDQRGVGAAHPVHARARVGVAGAEVEALHGHAVPEVGKQRPEHQLAVPGVRAAAEIAADQVRVPGFQVGRRHDVPRQDRRAKARRQLLDARLDAVGEALARSGPAMDPPAHLGPRRDVRVAIQRVFAGRRARRIADALLPDDQVRPLGQAAGARLTREPGEIVDALARVHDRALARRLDLPGHRP